MLKLSGKAFSGRDIAIRFQPHASVRFPSSLSHLFPDLSKELRAVFLDIPVQLWLRLEKYILVKFLHQPKNRAKGTHRFFSRVLQSPQPRHINMRVPHTVNGDIAPLFQPSKFLQQDCQGILHRAVKSIRVPIDLQKSLIQRLHQFIALTAVFFQQPNGLRNRFRVIIKLIRRLVEIADLRLRNPMTLFPPGPPSFKSGPQHKG